MHLSSQHSSLKINNSKNYLFIYLSFLGEMGDLCPVMLTKDEGLCVGGGGFVGLAFVHLPVELGNCGKSRKWPNIIRINFFSR